MRTNGRSKYRFEWWKSEERAAKGLQPWRFRYVCQQNGKITAPASEWYSSKAKMLKGIQTIKDHAADAAVVEVSR